MLPAIFIILASYAECQHVMVIVFFIISVGMHGFLTSGLNPNPMDLSPNYSGILLSVVNGAASITGILAPNMIGLMTPNVCTLVLPYYSTLVRLLLDKKVYKKIMRKSSICPKKL